MYIIKGLCLVYHLPQPCIKSFGLMICSAFGTDDIQYCVLMIYTHPRDKYLRIEKKR